MERRYYTECPEFLATILERGHRMQRKDVLHKMTNNNSLCETVAISLRAMTLFNQKYESYESKK